MSGRRLSGEAGGLPSPLTVLEQPPALAEELPHHGGRARPRRRRRGSGETQPRGDDGSAGRPGCPPRPRRSQASRAAFVDCAEASTKNPSRPCVDHQFTARLAEIATSRVIVGRKRCIPRASTAENGPCCTAALVQAATYTATPGSSDAAPRDPAGPAPRRAPEVHGRDDAPRRVDLEPREQVHWY